MTNPAVQAVDVIIPTYNNFQQLQQAITSMLAYSYDCPINIIIVNNGDVPIEQIGCTVVTPGKNLGWTGGLREGLKHSTSKYVVFANDDIFIPRSSARYLRNMKRELDLWENIGAIGPSSNVVMGIQNIWNGIASSIVPTSYLIGFFMLLRRDALEKAGGVHDICGGDDLDLSIRLRKAGYHLVVAEDAFVYHHGFQTGERVHGGPNKAGGWNSREMTEETNAELIKRHGFMEYWATIKNDIFHGYMANITTSEGDRKAEGFVDAETQAVQKFMNGEVNVYELGCGSRKSVPHAIGIDLVPAGQVSPYIHELSVADIVADVTKDIPIDDESADALIARHVLEHCIDPVSALRLWKSKLKTGGKLIVSCPDERVGDTIPMNPEHVHAYTPESLKNLLETVGFSTHGFVDKYNGMSFTMYAKKEN